VRASLVLLEVCVPAVSGVLDRTILSDDATPAHPASQSETGSISELALCFHLKKLVI
jgi:hypothetical protein